MPDETVQNLKSGSEKSNAGANARLADRDTSLIKNCWYVLDWSADVEHTLKNRMIVNQDLVYFRTQSGEVTALQNRCAHRCFPLHRGTLHDDDTLQCGYHGLTYNTEGQCVKVPSAVNQNPSYIKLQHYPVVERPPFVWVWPGDAAKADPALIGDYDWVNDGEWGYGDGFYHIKGSYLDLHENLMDITHFQFLHGAVLGTDRHAESEVEVTVKGDTVDNYRVNRGEPVPELHKKATGLGDAPITRHAHSTFITPGFHDALGEFEDPAGTVDGRTSYRPRILHIITPETNYSTFYWWIFARDFNPRDKALDKFYSEATRKVFTEDKEAIEWIEEQWAKEERPGFRQIHVPSDRGAVEMRRIVQRLADEQQREES